MQFPDSIEGFGYHFNEEGKLRNINTGEPYEFHFKENDQSYNQKRYEALGELITPAVYKLLEDECGLQQCNVPLKLSEKEPKTFIFCSKNYLAADKLLILIHGSGVVRAGQWARRLIINDCLDSGTQIPFIKRGLKEGYGVMVLNTNDNMQIINDKRCYIEKSDSPERHGKYVWKKYVQKCKAAHIAIVAHSYGGVVLTKLAEKFEREFRERVFAVALTDSVHFGVPKNSNLFKVGRNWVGSSSPLDTLVSSNYKDIPCVSAGCIEHEMTSWSSFNSIFKFFADRLAEVTGAEEYSESCSPEKVDSSTACDSPKEGSDNESSIRKAHSVSPDVSEISIVKKLNEAEELEQSQAIGGQTTEDSDFTKSSLEQSTDGSECKSSAEPTLVSSIATNDLVTSNLSAEGPSSTDDSGVTKSAPVVSFDNEEMEVDDVVESKLQAVENSSKSLPSETCVAPSAPPLELNVPTEQGCPVNADVEEEETSL